MLFLYEFKCIFCVSFIEIEERKMFWLVNEYLKVKLNRVILISR